MKMKLHQTRKAAAAAAVLAFTGAFAQTTYTYENGQWTPREPASSFRNTIVIKSDLEAGFSRAKDIIVEPGVSLTINRSMEMKGALQNFGTIVVKDGASFVQRNTNEEGTDDNYSEGVFVYEQNTKPLSRLQYAAWSTPVVSNITLKDFSPKTVDGRFYHYNDGRFEPVDAHRTKFGVGRGYLIRVPNDFPTAPETAVFTGRFEGSKPNNGNINGSLYFVEGTYAFVGNPYPSTLDLDAFLTANPKINATYIWNSVEANNVAAGQTPMEQLYFAYTITGSTEITGNELVPPAQGFLVARQEGVNSVNFTNDMRVIDYEFFNRGAKTADRFWLNIKNDAGLTKNLLVGYKGGSKNYEGGYDAELIPSGGADIYSSVEGKKLIIDGRGSFDAADALTLGVDVEQAGTYQLSLVKKEGAFDTQKIYLRDNETGATAELSAGEYSFTAEKSNPGRFTVYYDNAKLATGEAAKAGIQIYSNAGKVNVTSAETIAKISVYDLSGRLLTSQNVNAKKAEVAVNGSKLVLVNVELADGNKVNKKIKL
ncbi:hypothetical protein ACF3N7_02850 [Cruoricaptor ignavus]|uniref:hypothetical protein n=1 Tax=Cruoricaptor ignavus TaxID=1118202 RepID=UPI00370D8C8F